MSDTDPNADDPNAARDAAAESYIATSTGDFPGLEAIRIIVGGVAETAFQAGWDAALEHLKNSQ